MLSSMYTVLSELVCVGVCGSFLHIFPSAKEVMFLVQFVGFPAGLQKGYRPDFRETCCKGVAWIEAKNPLNFRVDANHGANTQIIFCPFSFLFCVSCYTLCSSLFVTQDISHRRQLRSIWG